MESYDQGEGTDSKYIIQVSLYKYHQKLSDTTTS